MGKITNSQSGKTSELVSQTTTLTKVCEDLARDFARKKKPTANFRAPKEREKTSTLTGIGTKKSEDFSKDLGTENCANGIRDLDLSISNLLSISD